MAITMPQGVNQWQFLQRCKNAGTSVCSRFPGVYLVDQKGRAPVWVAKLEIKSPKRFTKIFGQFELTEKGEIEASEAYIKGRKEYEDQHGPIRAAGRPSKQPE